jgi:hypothetical protein
VTGGREGTLVLRASVVVLVLAGAGLAAGWLASARTATAVYVAPGPVGRIELVVAAGDVDVVGVRGTAVRVERTDHYAFGHLASERRSFAGVVLRLSSTCPRIIVGSCSASYRVTVPDAVTVAVRTGAGRVHFEDFRGPAEIRSGSGPVSVDAFCGFELTAVSDSGDVRVISACTPERLDLRTASGSATAIVPPGTYRVAARTLSGHAHVRGVIANDRATFSISVESRSGDVTVAGGL